MNFTELVGRALGFENVTSIRQITPSLAAPWAHHAAGWVFFGCVGLSVLSFVFYLKYQSHGRPAARVALATLRALLLSLLLVFLADPVLNVEITSQPRPLLWVLFDGTDSMAIEDQLPDAQRAKLSEATGLTVATSGASPATSATNSPGNSPATAKPARMDFVKAWLKKQDKNVLTDLQAKFRLRAFVFDRPDGVRALEASHESSGDLDLSKAADGLTTTGQVTALGKAFEDLGVRHSMGNLAGVVVVSDFDQNSGPAPLASAQNLRVPVYTIGVGPTSAIDLGVDLQSPPLMKKEERSTVTVTLRQTGLEGEAVPVTVTARRLGGSSDSLRAEDAMLVGTRSVELKGPVTPLEFAFTPKETGRFEFVAEAPLLSGEVVEQNNRAAREVNIRDDFLRLMFVEYEPTWEWRFIKEVFYRDNLVGARGFRTFLRSADPKVRQSNELFLPTLTPQRSEFFANDVIFLGDMPASTLSPRFCELVKEFVGKFGGGLVVIAGPRFGPGQLAGTPLADMLPVVVDADTKVRDAREFTLQLTDAAEQIDFMQLGSDDAENGRAWGNLGPLPWYQPVQRLHPLATALAVHPQDVCSDGKTPQPLVAIRRYGRGEVVYLGFDETWRLRRKYGELYYRQLWGQMIHRLGLSHVLGSQKRFVVRTDRPNYQVDDKVTLTVEAYDANFEPLSDDKLADHKLTGEVVAPERSGALAGPQSLNIPQLREGVFEAHIPAAYGGEYRVRVKDPVTGEQSEVDFQVASLSAERRSAVRNVNLQQEIADATGGRSYDLVSAERLPEEIQPKLKDETSKKVFQLWDTWLGFGVVVGLMLTEWLVRKLNNLT
jgi:hypothetical protein